MPLQDGKTCVAHIRDQHRRRRVGDAQGRFRVSHCELRREAARPEDGQLALGDFRISDILITPAQVNSDIFRAADVNGSPVHVGKTRRDLNRANRIGRLEGAHRHHQGPLEVTRRRRRNVRHIDAGDIVALEEPQP